jgi:hypothetical protein
MTARVSAPLTVTDSDGRWRMGVVAKRTYEVRNGAAVDAAVQMPLVEEPVMADDGGVTLAHDVDLYLRKAQTDVIVLGHAYPHEDARRTTASVRVGKQQRDLRVFGPRRIEHHPDGRLVFSSPERFDRVSLGWESAYGGHDATALATYGDPTEKLRRSAGLPTSPQFGLYAYPRNPAGRGYLVELTDKAMEVTQLPQLEDPRYPFTPDALVAGNSLAWPAGPAPVSTAFMPYTFFPRSVNFGFPAPLFDFARFPTKSFHEVAAGLIEASALAEDAHVATLFDLRGLQSAAPGMRWSNVPLGSDVELRNLHPQVASWRFRLPARPPRMFIRRPNQPPTALEPVITTIVMEPDKDRMTLLWAGDALLNPPFEPAQLQNLEHAVLWT